MLTSRNNHLLSEQTKGDGNCAFNAFILGLSRQSVIENMEMGFIHAGENPDVGMKEFIRDAANKLNVPSQWSIVKRELLGLRQNSKIALQNKVAPILRTLAINLAEKDEQHESRTIEPLLSAFDDYIELQQNKKRKVIEDDLFSRHPFIQQKFEEFYARRTKSQNIFDELKNWWFGRKINESGYQQFLKEMKKEGVWAGDLELFQLARYFRVNLDVLRKNFVHRIYSHSGKIPCHYFTDDQVAQLIDRQVINPPEFGDKELTFLPLTEKEIVQRLQKVPEFEKVSWYIVENEFIKGFAVPPEWSECLEQLWFRNVIEKKNDRHVFSVDKEVAIKYAASISDYEKVISLWRKYHCEAPTVTLSQEDIHWSNVLPQEETSSSFIYDYYKTFMSFVTDNFFSRTPIKKSPLFFQNTFCKENLPLITAASTHESRRNADL